MPPNHNRSTGALRIARMISVGDAVALSSPIAATASGGSVTDFWLRETMTPPFDSFDLS